MRRTSKRNRTRVCGRRRELGNRSLILISFKISGEVKLRVHRKLSAFVDIAISVTYLDGRQAVKEGLGIVKLRVDNVFTLHIDIAPSIAEFDRGQPLGEREGQIELRANDKVTSFVDESVLVSELSF